jgi:hypothetical protein
VPISLHDFAAIPRIALRDLIEDIENPALNRPVKLAELTLCGGGEANGPGQGAF